ncbi:LamG-like jellyroll fold domain-containing protein [Aeoliella sp.]|uniref:LamG-like jellyroll fold domain-containing protein n=1 Tax=Aeoliella sp. TaxID=2795800 RepID=UPI003CCBE4F8
MTSTIRRCVTVNLFFYVCSGLSASAVELLYNFEGDAGAVATDKLTDDGAQDGTLLGNVSVTSGTQAPFGAQAGKFDIPFKVNPPFSSVQVPGSSVLGDSYTLAVHAQIEDPTPSPFRIFSSYGGTGGVGADRILFDHQPDSLRAIIGGTSVSAPTTSTFPTAGYHHYALTVDNGTATIYFDGQSLGTALVPTGNALSTNLFVGEDAHDLGGSANEQILGNVDDIVVVDEVLSPTTIMQLASGGSASSVLSPSGLYAVNYDFEGGSPLDDKFVSDGSQNAVLTVPVAATIDPNPANAAEGMGSLLLENAVNYIHPKSQIDTSVSGTDLGDKFTVSAVVNVPQGGYASDGLIRLFTSYPGGGSAAQSMIVDFNPDADVSNIGIRFLLPGSKSATYDGTFTYDEDHTITAVYNDGEMSIYLDGTLVKQEVRDGGVVDLGAASLLIGEDSGGGVNENLIGIVDDVLILDRAVSANQVRYLARFGAEAMLAVPEPTGLMTSLIAMLTLGAALMRYRASQG